MQPEATTLPPTFTRGELVWGYARGFPWWPCQIRSVRALKEAEPKVRIRFLRTLDNIELPVSSVKPYAPHVAEYSVVTKKMFKSAGPRKKFEEALQQAKEWAERGGPPPLPEGETEVWSDDDVVDDEDVEAAQKEAAAHLEKWREDGHELIGTHVSRFSRTHTRMHSSSLSSSHTHFLLLLLRRSPATLARRISCTRTIERPHRTRTSPSSHGGYLPKRAIYSTAFMTTVCVYYSIRAASQHPHTWP